jgi:translation initiation factor 2B subunit (eIF-2B alpha/beta/delta family)/isopentenyldiphosphate isomerase
VGVRDDGEFHTDTTSHTRKVVVPAAERDGMPHVVTCFLQNAESVLLVRRADDASTYPGLWAGVSGYVEGDPDATDPDARRELSEETGLADEDLRLVRAGDPLTVHDSDGGPDDWVVHPYLFETTTREVTTNEEIAAVEWVQPTAIRDRETVPGLWDVYRRVGPRVVDVADDETHGSAQISVRALAVLRDAAGDAERNAESDAVDGGWQSVAETARALRESHPGMAPLRTRIDRVMAESDRTPGAVRQRAETAVTDALAADDGAAGVAAERLNEVVADAEGTDAERPTVLTCSRSGTVAEALRRTEPRPNVVVTDSRPGGEGVDVAESLAREFHEDDTADATVTLVPDSAVAQVLAEPEAIDAPDVDAVLVGSDAILPDAGVVNKVGTRGVALAADAADVPVFVVTARDKISGTDEFVPESVDAVAVSDGDAPVEVVAPLFDRTPADLVTAVLTEGGALSPDAVRSVAAEHAELAGWLSAVEG